MQIATKQKVMKYVGDISDDVLDIMSSENLRKCIKKSKDILHKKSDVIKRLQKKKQKQKQNWIFADISNKLKKRKLYFLKFRRNIKDIKLSVDRDMCILLYNYNYICTLNFICILYIIIFPWIVLKSNSVVM